MRQFLTIVMFSLLSGMAFANQMPVNILGTAPAVTPNDAWTYYQGQGVTSPTSGQPRDQRIVDLARALRSDPDTIYEFVHDNIEFEPLFGLKKGAYGAIVDKSGTAFDQAHLMVELLRESGYTASYVYGTIQLSLAEIESWLGVSGLTITAAKQIFADGGIPVADIGGGLEIAHVWVKVDLPGESCGANCIFDPSYKQHDIVTGAIADGSLNLSSATGYSNSALMTAAAPQGATADFVKNVNEVAIEANLNTYATNLANEFKQNYADASLEEIIGGKTIQRLNGVTVRNSTHPKQGSITATWTNDIPYTFRTKVTITGVSLSFPSNLTHTFYSEELSGRRVAITHNVTVAMDSAATSGSAFLQVDETPIESVPINGIDIGDLSTVNRAVNITIELDQPYAAKKDAQSADGSYMDRTTAAGQFVDTGGDLNGFAAFIIGFGHVSQAYANEIGRFVVSDDRVRRQYHDSNGDGKRDGCSVNGTPCNPDILGNSAQYQSKLSYAASWLAQSTRAMDIHARMLGGVAQHHGTIGVVSSWFYLWQNNQIKNEFQIVDAHAGWSFNAKDGDAAKRIKFYHAFGGILSSLEASIVLQQSEQPDNISTNSNLRWFSQQTKPGGLYTGANDGIWHITPSNWTSIKPILENSNYIQATLDEIEGYLNAGYYVVAPTVASLGPGEEDMTPVGASSTFMIGSTLLAYQPTNPSGIAHLVKQYNSTQFKGGGAGGTLDTKQFPGPDGEFLEDQFKNFAGSFDVDLQSGEMTLTPPPDLAVGSGEFPYSLSFQRTYSTAIKGRDGPMGLGWRHAYDIRLNMTSDSDTYLGARAAIHAVDTLAAFHVMHDLASASPAIETLLVNAIVQDWWGRQVFNNVVTVHRGNDSDQFVRLPDGTYMPQTGSTASLIQTGEPEYIRREHEDLSPLDPDPLLPPPHYTKIYKGYRYSNITFTYKLSDRSEIDFVFLNSPDISYHPSGGSGYSYDLGKGKGEFRSTQWRFPYGVTIDFTFTPAVDPNDWVQNYTLTRISNNLGRALNFSYAGFQLQSVSDDYGRSISLTYKTLDDLGAISDFQPVPPAHSYILETVQDVLGETVTYEYEESTGLAMPHGITITDPMRPQLARVFLPSGTPSDDSTAYLALDHDSFGRVKSISDALGQTTEYFVAEGGRGEAVNPVNLAGNGRGSVEFYDEKGRRIRTRDALGNESTFEYDGLGRTVRQTAPGGSFQTFQYDGRHNRIATVVQPKPGSTEDVNGETIVTLAEYDASFNQVTREIGPFHGTEATYSWNSGTQSWVVTPDPGVVVPETTHTYDTATGQRLTTTQPQVADGSQGGTPANPVTTWVYNGLGQVTQETGPDGLVTDYIYDVNNDLDETHSDPAGLNVITKFDWDAVGNLTAFTDPRNNITSAQYDARRRITRLDQPEGAAMEWVYNQDGLVTQIRQATGAPAPDDFAVTQFAYFATGRAQYIEDPEGDRTLFAYDTANRREITTDAVGRKTRTVYDAAGQIVQEIRAYQTALEQVDRETAYDADGNPVSLKDANGNETTYGYDGFSRLAATTFPDGNPNLGPGQDYESYTYDAAKNIVAKRTRRADVITYAYDALNRMTAKTVPGAGGGGSFTYAYDLAGRQVEAVHDGLTETQVYDALGSLIEERQNGALMAAHQYDAAGNHTRLTWADGYFVDYAFDAENRISSVTENGATSLATLTYDVLSRTRTLTYGNGASVSFDYEPDSDLKEIVHTFVSGGAPLTGGGTGIEFAYQYTKAAQLSGASASLAGMIWSPMVGRTENYAVNSLNQYTTVTADGAPAAPTYDDNGNLTGDGQGASYTFDAENRLTAATMGAQSITYRSYANGARRSKDVGGTVTQYLVSSDHVIAEYDGPGDLAGATLLRRYVHGPGTDRPIAMVEGDAGSGYTHTWYHADRLGSVVALTDDIGAEIARYAYSAYGVPYLVDPATGAQTQVAAGQPYLFTGRRFDFENGLYYYRARYYSAPLGRFLQTDPVGYEDQMNLYAYVGNDPVNGVDPTGKVIQAKGTAGEILVINQAIKNIEKSNPKTAARIRHLRNSKKVHTVRFPKNNEAPHNKTTGNRANASNGKGTGSETVVDPTKSVTTTNKDGSSVVNSGETVLTHELGGHAYDKDRGKHDPSINPKTGEQKSEESAMRAENEYKDTIGEKHRDRH